MALVFLTNQSVVRQNSNEKPITFDTQLKTTLIKKSKETNLFKRVRGSINMDVLLDSTVNEMNKETGQNRT